ncbi:hypothetical protein [Asaia astilbis]|uniref:hypothetical protein n=1 Tax=Asaia astilbis TaxID=610244 RepID=UPI00046EE7F1|nr:hypothetical protein [Asaia astilbis]
MSETLEAPVNDAPSTQIEREQSTALGAGNEQQDTQADTKPEPDAKPQTRREAIEAAVDKAEKSDPAPEAAKKPPEGREAPESKPATEPAEQREAPAEEGKDKAEETEKRQIKAPRRFLAKAQETWANTPNAVKSEVARMERDYEALMRDGMEDRQYRQNLREFEEYAGKSGAKLTDALRLYTDIDRHLAENPVQAIAEIMKRVGLSPEQYSQIVTQNSPQYQALMMQRRAQMAQPQQEPAETQHLRAQLYEEQSKRVHAEVVAPFRTSHPRFDELQETIAQCLNSGMIPQGLSHNERLEAAYDMADRLTPRSMPTQASLAASEQDHSAQTANPRAGKSLSVKGAPSSGISSNPVRRGKLSRREAIDAAMARADRR